MKDPEDDNESLHLLPEPMRERFATLERRNRRERFWSNVVLVMLVLAAFGVTAWALWHFMRMP